MISVKNLETLLRLAVSCREYPACSVRPEDLEDMVREILENRRQKPHGAKGESMTDEVKIAELEGELVDAREHLEEYHTDMTQLRRELSRAEEQVRQLREALKNLRNHWNDPSYNLRRDALVQADAALTSTEPKEKA
jgi:predicted RNase H-like nuclease (RuvC/YqgF family)